MWCARALARTHANIQFKMTLTSDKNAQNTKCLAGWLVRCGDLAPPTRVWLHYTWNTLQKKTILRCCSRPFYYCLQFQFPRSKMAFYYYHRADLAIALSRHISLWSEKKNSSSSSYKRNDIHYNIMLCRIKRSVVVKCTHSKSESMSDSEGVHACVLADEVFIIWCRSHIMNNSRARERERDSIAFSAHTFDVVFICCCLCACMSYCSVLAFSFSSHCISFHFILCHLCVHAIAIALMTRCSKSLLCSFFLHF